MMMRINIPSNISNVGCDMCNNLDIPGYTKLSIGKVDHILCYKCAAKLTMGLVNYAYTNLSDEIKEVGYEFVTTNKDDTFEIKRI